MKRDHKYLGKASLAILFIATFGFFQFAYPYHLMRREQLALFLFDGDYIHQTYRGIGWLSHFLADFIDQFFYYPVVGPIVITALLFAIGFVTYKICSKFLPKWPALAIASVLFIWSFARETENQFCTQYTIVTLGYLSLLLGALQFKKLYVKASVAIAFIAIGVWALGNPYHEHYGKLWGTPQIKLDKMIALDVQASRCNWDKVFELSKDDLRMTEASFYYNLACAQKGSLGSHMLSHSQNYDNGLFIWVSDQNSPFSNSIAGEVWFHLGDMTIAEQSTVISLQASPNHTGARYIKRLAEINLITGENGLAEKYLNLLSKTLRYRNWAIKRMPQSNDPEINQWLENSRKNLSKEDIIYGRNEYRPILQGLVKANPDNRMAKEYLLCYDLMRLDILSFIEDYTPDMANERMYQEALVIYLNLTDGINQENFDKYGVTEETLKREQRFYQFPGQFKNSYWYFYMNETSR